MRSLAVAGVLRRLDPHHAAKLSELTLERYRAAARPFVAWYSDAGVQPDVAEEWDDCLIEYTSAVRLSKAKFE